jgi:hypothetical protein
MKISLIVTYFILYLCSCRTVVPIQKWDYLSLNNHFLQDLSKNKDLETLNMRLTGESYDLISFRPLGIDLFSSRSFINHDECYLDAIKKAPNVIALRDIQIYWDYWYIPFLGYSVSKEIIEGTPIVRR